MGRSRRLLHHHDRLPRSPNLSRSGSSGPPDPAVHPVSPEFVLQTENVIHSGNPCASPFVTACVTRCNCYGYPEDRLCSCPLSAHSAGRCSSNCNPPRHRRSGPKGQRTTVAARRGGRRDLPVTIQSGCGMSGGAGGGTGVRRDLQLWIQYRCGMSGGVEGGTGGRYDLPPAVLIDPPDGQIAPHRHHRAKSRYSRVCWRRNRPPLRSISKSTTGRRGLVRPINPCFTILGHLLRSTLIRIRLQAVEP